MTPESNIAPPDSKSLERTQLVGYVIEDPEEITN